MFLALAFLLIAAGNSSGYLSQCLIVGASPEFRIVSNYFVESLIFLVVFSAQALWFTPTHIIKDCRILGDRFVLVFSYSWQEFSLRQLMGVVLYVGEDKAPLLVQLKFRDHRRVLVDDLVDMPQFVASLRASVSEDITFETKPHLGVRSLKKILVPYIAVILGCAFTRHFLPDTIGLVIAVSLMIMLFVLIAACARNPSLGRVKFGPLDR